MFRIGEFSKITGLSVPTLRFYHDKGVLVPSSIDDESGYRYYDEAAVEKARIITTLRGLDFSLDDVIEILADHSDDADIVGFLERQKVEIAKRIDQQANILRQLDQIISNEQEAQEILRGQEVEEKSLDPILVGGVRMTGQYSDCGKGFSLLGRRVGRYASGKPMTLYYDGEYKEQDADFEPCFPLNREVEAKGVEVHELPACRVVSLIHRGPYEKLALSYTQVLRFVREHDYEISLPTRECYLKGPGMIFRGNPKKYLTEIQLPIEA